MATLTETLPNIDLSKVEPPRLDIPDAVTGALEAAGIRRASPRRWPFALGVVAASLAAWAILSNEAVRTRLNEVASSIRERILTMRSPASDPEPVAFPAAETKPIEPGPLAEYDTQDVAEYPPGLGSEVSSSAGAATAPGGRRAQSRSASVVSPEGLEPSTR